MLDPSSIDPFIARVSSSFLLDNMLMFSTINSVAMPCDLFHFPLCRTSFALGAQLTRDLPGEPMSIQEIQKMR